MFLFPNKPKIISKKENWASFEIDSLYPGYGVTIGNSLRRVLLSSLEGVAITQIKIKGVNHEFSTIQGVLEDAIILISNLKKMRFKMYAEEPQRAVLKLKGEKEAKGSDFELPSQVELINKSCHIADLTDKKSDLEIEIQIEKGVGYLQAGSLKKNSKMEIGMIPIDAIFTPIRRVSYKVENMRVGERTDFDRLMIEIETDGAIDPEEAFLKSCEILVKHFSLLIEPFAKDEKEEKKEATPKKESKKKKTTKKKSK